MSDDLVKRARNWNQCWPSRDIQKLVPEMADRIEDLEAKLEKAALLDFRPGSEAPEIPTGTGRSFIVTVRRSGRERTFTFPAVYLHAYPLDWNDDGCGECPEDGSHDDGCPTTGWFDARFHYDYDNFYEFLLSPGDTLLEWAAIPDRTTIAEHGDGQQHKED